LIIIMFIGRIGLLTLLSCFIPFKQAHHYQYPTEHIPIN
jgi:Trk-type K+ transport system membrane component